MAPPSSRATSFVEEATPCWARGSAAPPRLPPRSSDAPRNLAQEGLRPSRSEEPLERTLVPEVELIALCGKPSGPPLITRPKNQLETDHRGDSRIDPELPTPLLGNASPWHSVMSRAQAPRGPPGAEQLAVCETATRLSASRRARAAARNFDASRSDPIERAPQERAEDHSANRRYRRTQPSRTTRVRAHNVFR